MSSPKSENLPSVDSASIIMTQPTPSERLRIWQETYPEWGGALSMAQYIARERFLLTTAQAQHGGNTAWILTDGAQPPGTRPILSSCETFRKRAWAKIKDESSREVTAHGIGSVFTFRECRGKGYAGKMMALLAQHLDIIQQKSQGDAVFSVLYSDIGKEFYARSGWKPFESTHLLIPSSSISTSTGATTSGNLTPITNDLLPSLAECDTILLETKMASFETSKTAVALIPDLDSLQWHHSREEFVCKTLTSRSPTVHGALYTPADAPNSRIWVVWSRTYYGGQKRPDKNIMHVIRVVIEDEEGTSDQTMTEAMKAIVELAQKEAKDWNCGNIDLWNPSEKVRKAVLDLKEFNAEHVVREKDGITSLQYFGERPDDFEWVANEYFAWC